MQRPGRGARLPCVHEMAAAAAAGGAAAGEDRPGPRPRVLLRSIVTGAEPASTPDELDFEEYVSARGAALVRLARGLLRDPQHAEDLVQDVLVRAHQRWSAIRRTSNPDGYVYRMLVNGATSFWRRAARRELATETHRMPAPGVADASDQHGDRELLLALLRRLPAKQRAVLVLRHYEGLPDAEIAQLMGTSAVTVRSNAHRGLASLRAMLAELEAGDPDRTEEVRRRA